MKVAKAKGRLRGKQPKLNRKHEAHLVSLVHSVEHSTAEVAELFGVGHPRSTEPSKVCGLPRWLAWRRREPHADAHRAPAVPHPTPQRDAGASAPERRASSRRWFP